MRRLNLRQLRTLALLVAIALSGCVSAGEPEKSVDVRTSPNGSQATWAADPARLEDDVARAVDRMHWGLLAVHKPVNQVIHAEALLPDGRTAKITAEPADEKQVTATVFVGEFGDKPEEQTYLRRLAAVMDGPPQPKRDWKFHLKEW